MHSLYVLRHGKSDWSAAYGSDHERPLKKRGRNAARDIGRFLSRTEQAPDLVLTSSAVRARTTAEIAAEAGSWDAALEVEDGFYHGSAETVLERVRQVDAGVGALLIVGHQPTWSELVAELTGGAAPAFPTAALARVDFAVADWSGIGPAAGVLTWLITPRLLAPFLD